MKIRTLLGLITALIVLGCGGANTPFVPSGGNTGGGGTSNFSIFGGTTQTINPGGTATFDVFVGLGQTGGRPTKSPLNVTLSTVGLPANATPSFSVNPVTPNDPANRSVLTVTTTNAVVPGNYNFTVRGTDGVNTRTTTCTLTVNQLQGGFTVLVEALDPSMRVTGDDNVANFNVNVTAPAGYQGNARLEWRFVDQIAPSQADMIAVWHYGAEQSTNTLEYTIGANNETDSAECTFTRQRNMDLAGNYTVEFRVVPLAAGFAPASATSTLNVFINDARPR